MRTLFLIAMLAPSLSDPQSSGDRRHDWSQCDDYQSLTEHQATALQRVSDCLGRGTSVEMVGCTTKVLAELED